MTARRWIAAGAAALALAACGKSDEQKLENSAAAQNYKPPFVISRLDYGSQVERRFRRLDRNADDVLSGSEVPPRHRNRMMTLDADRDGRISAQEFSLGMMKHFDAQDADRDGTVTSAERTAYRAGHPRPAET